MKKWFIALCLFLISSTAFAQSLPDAQCNVLKQMGAKFGALNHGSDDQRREFALKVAQQFAFSFPGEGWGSKSAGPGRPQTKDVVARQKNGALDGWDLVNGSTLDVVCTSHVDLAGQVFIPVTPVDYLGTSTPPPPPPPPSASGAATADLQQQQMILLLQIIQKLEEQNAALTKGLAELKAQIATGVKVRF